MNVIKNQFTTLLSDLIRLERVVDEKVESDAPRCLISAMSEVISAMDMFLHAENKRNITLEETVIKLKNRSISHE